jgi:hypothetical protein
VEVKIGVRNVAREIQLESDQSAEEIQATVTKALTDKTGTLSLTDEKGRTVVVPVEALGYVDIGATEKARVGFGLS